MPPNAPDDIQEDIQDDANDIQEEVVVAAERALMLAFAPRDIGRIYIDIPRGGWLYPSVHQSTENVPEGHRCIYHYPGAGVIDVEHLRVQIGLYQPYGDQEIAFGPPDRADFTTANRRTSVGVHGDNFNVYVGYGVFIPEWVAIGDMLNGYTVCRVLWTDEGDAQ